jgi:hypothetical protein
MRKLEFGFVIFLFVLMAAAAADALTFPFLARLFPLAAALIGLAALSFELVRMYRAAPVEAPDPESDGGPRDFIDRIRLGLPFLGWLLAYYAAMYLFGFLVASGLFVATFLNRIGGVRVLPAAVAGILVIAWLAGVSWLFVLEWPDGVFAPHIVSGF